MMGLGALIMLFAPEPENVTGFDSATTELLTRPYHEVLARQIAVANGAPEFMWRKYTPLAVAEILAAKKEG